MKTKDRRYFKILNTYKKLQGIKKPYNATFYKCECDCGNIFHVRSERLKTTRACKACTYTIVTKEKKGGLFTTVPNFSVLRRKYKGYEKRAKAKGLEFTLTIEIALKLFNSNCDYCGLEPQKINAIYSGNTVDGVCKANTIDRIDSSKGYTIDNIVPCCNTCNKAKLIMSKKEFLDWITKVYTYQNK